MWQIFWSKRVTFHWLNINVTFNIDRTVFIISTDVNILVFVRLNLEISAQISDQLSINEEKDC